MVVRAGFSHQFVIPGGHLVPALLALDMDMLRFVNGRGFPSGGGGVGSAWWRRHDGIYADDPAVGKQECGADPYESGKPMASGKISLHRYSMKNPRKDARIGCVAQRSSTHADAVANAGKSFETTAR